MSGQLIDLHSHILPGLDDGSRNIRESLEMARMAVKGGIRVMAATPHGDMVSDPAMIFAAVRDLSEALRKERIPLRLLVGMEILGSSDTARLLKENKLYTLNSSNYPLIEFHVGAGDSMPERVAQTRILQDVIQAGFRPIIAHPERYASVRKNPAIVNLWSEMGCLFQINRGSLLGRFGGEVQEVAMELTRRGFATVVASDAHRQDERVPRLDDIWTLLERRVAPQAAQCLLLENPRRLLKNQEPVKMKPEWF